MAKNIIQIDNAQNKIKNTREIKKLIKTICEKALEYEKFDKPYELSVSLVDNEHIRELNKEFRQKDVETDVLSFPIIDWDEGIGSGDLYGKYVILGDVALSLEKAKAQSEEYGHSLDREIAFLTAHSILHLLGYDHTEDEESRKVMREREEAILALCGLTR